MITLVEYQDTIMTEELVKADPGKALKITGLVFKFLGDIKQYIFDGNDQYRPFKIFQVGRILGFIKVTRKFVKDIISVSRGQ